MMAMNLFCIKQAASLIAPFIQQTPLKIISLPHGNSIFLKCEHLQETGSFKVRGAFYTLLNLSDANKKRGVITRSAGNFAKALAFAGQKLAVPVTVVMPVHAPEVKKEGVRSYGARLIVHGSNHAESQARVDELVLSDGLVGLSPYDHNDVIIGQGTLGLEVVQQLPTITRFIAPVSGGGLLGGSAFALKQLNPTIETVAVEPEGAGDYFLSRQTGIKQTLASTQSIADGLLAPTVGQLNWPLLQNNVDRAFLVSDKQIIEAMRFLYEKHDMIVEPSGAVSVAAAIFYPELTASGDVVAVISGGNVDKDRFYGWINP